MNVSFGRHKIVSSHGRKKVTMLRMTTSEAAGYFHDHEVRPDFVYVDARFDYCGCKEVS